jgi:hypothetical protein
MNIAHLFHELTAKKRLSFGKKGWLLEAEHHAADRIAEGHHTQWARRLPLSRTGPESPDPWAQSGARPDFARMAKNVQDSAKEVESAAVSGF